MPAVSNLDKAVADRDAVSATIDMLQDQLNTNAISPMSESEVDLALRMVKEAQVNLMEIQTRITHCSPTNQAEHNISYNQLFAKIFKLLGGFTGLKMKFPVTSNTIPSSSSSDIRLPRMNLPTFDGNLQNWISFRDLFITTVHDSKVLSKSQKLSYLKAQLQGEAARQISSLLITDANYDIAWSQLVDRYQNDRELFLAIMRRFQKQPIIQLNSSSSIRQLIDTSRECIRSLDILSMPTDQWDSILWFIIYEKVDTSSKELWEQNLKDSSVPTLKTLFDFLEARARALAASGQLTGKPTRPMQLNQFQGDKNNRNPARPLVHHAHMSQSCIVCQDSSHPTFKCATFLGWSVQQRSDATRKSRACYNCLREGHQVSQCPSNKGCRTCSAKHHTLLHQQRQARPPTDPNPQGEATPKALFVTNPNQVSPISSAQNKYDTILATVLVQVKDQYGNLHFGRALADNGCNTHFVTEAFVRRLGIQKKRCFTAATGLGESTIANSNAVTSFSVSPHFDETVCFSISRCLVTPKITGKLPSTSVDPTKWSHLQNLKLADPNFFKSQDVDMLLGAEFFFSIIEVGKLASPLNTNSPVALNSSFGWLIGGGNGSAPLLSPQVHSIVSRQDSPSKNSQPTASNREDEALDTILRRFWEIETEPSERLHTLEESAAETHFRFTHRRDASGRFMVELPFKSPRVPLGSSIKIAERRLRSLERRLEANPEHRSEYIKFMNEYEQLGHMEEIETVSDSSHNSPTYYIPHHFVMKESSTTTKFRVVFDASAKTSNGVSLNDTMMVGPTIQDSLVDLLIRFRLHKVAFTADIAKMYRQVRVSPQDANLQRILWRDDTSKNIKHFRLLTVTYGTAAAPFLATRVLQELATQESGTYPRAAAVSVRDFYVDDLMSGEPSIEEALATQSELMKLMDSGSLSLRKWSSNCQEILNALPPEMRETQTLLSFDTDSTVKTLGIYWNPEADNFLFKISSSNCTSKPITKRLVLSELARLFDPIGWLAPVIITAKILMQSLWKLESGWDDVLPLDVRQQWSKFREDIKGLNNLNINRFLFEGTAMTCPTLNAPSTYSNVKFCLAGFSDASQKAYAAVVYLCAYDSQGHKSVSLVTSKTRVAPTKAISIPRLELCGASILAELIPSVQAALRIPIGVIGAWTDSTVALAWIKSNPSRWKTFVANRVTKIQARLPPEMWYHVPGHENPADCASRGIVTSDLLNHPLWWNGPSLLEVQFSSMHNQPTDTKSSTPLPFHLFSAQPRIINTPNFTSEDEEVIIAEAKKFITCQFVLSKEDDTMLNRYSSILKLARITAYMFRFIHNCRTKGFKKDKIMTLQNVLSDPLTPSEIEHGTQHWIKKIQQQSFHKELEAIRHNSPLPKKSKITALSPLIDKAGVLRVGGRLKNSTLSDDQKTPILLPRHSKFTELLIHGEHLRHFHAGPQLLLSVILRRYWIVRAKDSIRQQIRRCVTCSRMKAVTMEQVMADLPAFRVTPTRPFSKSGIDYAGPFQIRSIHPRSKITLKAYLAIFVCFVTHAVHLEVVTSLSTEVFLAALKRFVARRGRPSDLFSDCGTNFVGANTEMKQMLKLILSQSHNQIISDQLSQEGVKWHFNPPASPHFGGLWEAGVKSTKFHLHRIMGSHRLTFEELTTATTQIEAILNSRPLTPESCDPSDLNALTPGHFLIGAPLTAIPEPTLDHIPTSRLSRWQLIQQMTQSFWKRWSNEYLTRLQQRPKWMNGTKSIAINDMVLVKEENLPPLKWQLARVQELHPGQDNVTRVVTVRTSSRTLKRPIVKLCLLPIDNPTQISTSSSSHEPSAII